MCDLSEAVPLREDIPRDQFRLSTAFINTTKAVVVLDRCHPASQVELSTKPAVRITAKFISEENEADKVQAHYVQVAPSAADMHPLYARMRGHVGMTLVPSSYKRSVVTLQTLGALVKEFEPLSEQDDVQAKLCESAVDALFYDNPIHKALAVFAYVDADAEGKLGRAGAPDNPVQEKAVIEKAGPLDLEADVLSLGHRAAAAQDHSFFTGRQRIDVLIMDDLVKSTRSLVPLVHARHRPLGFFQSRLSHHVGMSFTPLQDAPCSMHWMHHQMTGTSWWFVLHVNQEEKIKKMALALSKQAHSASKEIVDGGDLEASVTMIRYHAKAIMPSINLLKKHQIQYDVVYLHENRIIHGRGPYFSISVGEQTTTSFTSYQLDQLWPVSGIANIERYMEWLESLAHAEEEEFDELMHAHDISLTQLSSALAQTPPDFLCALMHALLQDPDSDELTPHMEALAPVGNLQERCKAILKTLHSDEVKKFLRVRLLNKQQGFRLCKCKPYGTHHIHSDARRERDKTACS
jgi:hypothetical protein